MSTPNPFGLDSILQNYRPTQLGASATLGNPEAMQQQQANMAQLMEAYKRAQQQSQTGASMMQPQYVQNSGGLGALAMIAQAAAGKHIQKKADETAAEYAQRIGEAEMLSQRQQAEAAAAADERKFRQRLDLEREKGRIKSEQPTDAIRTLQALSSNPSLAKLDQSRKQAGAARTSVNMPVQENAFQKGLGKSQSDQFVSWQADAILANEIKQKLSQVKEISALQKTGKIEEAKAKIGQYFGTEAGANMQAWNAAITPMILDAAAKLKPISNFDIVMIEKSMPNFGSDPRANERILKMMESAADRQIGLYDSAADYVQKNRSLDGFRPTFTPRQEAKEQGQSPIPSQPVRATNPETGESVELRNGQWVKVQ